MTDRNDAKAVFFQRTSVGRATATLHFDFNCSLTLNFKHFKYSSIKQQFALSKIWNLNGV